jgi:hypothetical protein
MDAKSNHAKIGVENRRASSLSESENMLPLKHGHKLCEHIDGLIHVLVQTACQHLHPFGRCSYFYNGTDVPGRVFATVLQENHRLYPCSRQQTCLLLQVRN